MTEPAPMDILQRLSAAAAQLLDARAEQAAAQEALDRANNVVNDLEGKMIPDLLEEAGMQTFTTKDGMAIELTHHVSVNAKNPAVHEWLRRTGNEGLIKSQVTVPFTKGHEDDARNLVKELAAREIGADLAVTVATNSLQALIKRMLKEGQDVPLADMNVHLMPRVSVKLPK
jgi:hypothetical protein